MWVGLVVVVTLLLLAAVHWVRRFVRLRPGHAPWSDERRRKTVCQVFNARRVPEQIDAIFVGGGLGSLSCAGMLARVGWRALVLEQVQKNERKKKKKKKREEREERGGGRRRRK